MKQIMNRIMKKAHSNLPFTVMTVLNLWVDSNQNYLVLHGPKLDQNTLQCAQVRSSWNTAPHVPLYFTGSKKR